MKPLIVGNWKMNGNYISNRKLLGRLKDFCDTAIADFAVCVPYPYLFLCKEMLTDSGIQWGAQTISAHEQGAYTGQVSISMIKDFDAHFVITGHSERRHGLAESEAVVAKQTQLVIDNGLTAIACVGETLDQKKQGELAAVLQRQILPILDQIKPDQWDHLVIAYEPIWAIGTGEVATPAEVQQALELIKNLLQEKDAKFFNSVKILYGGSVKPNNAQELMAIDQVDGFLVGGASLDAVTFSEIGTCK